MPARDGSSFWLLTAPEIARDAKGRRARGDRVNLGASKRPAAPMLYHEDAMSGTPVMTDRKARTDALLASEDTIDNVCSHVGSGGTLAEWCRDRDISFVVINDWIEADSARRERYADALLKRDAHNRDLVTTMIRNFADFDPALMLDDKGLPKPLSEIPPYVRRCIVGIDIEELYAGRGEDRMNVGRVIKIKFANRNQAAETLARTLRMLTDKKEIEAGATLADLIAKGSGS